MKRYEAEGAKQYREANRKIQKAVKKAKKGLESLDRYSVRRGRNLPEQKQKQQSIPAGEGCNLRETG